MMRRALRVALVFLGAAIHLCSAADEGDRNWSIAEATRAGDGRKVIYRYQERFGPGFQRAQFPDRVTIAWPYDTRTGLPSHSDLQAMDRLEESLRPYVETAAVSRLAWLQRATTCANGCTTRRRSGNSWNAPTGPCATSRCCRSSSAC